MVDLAYAACLILETAGWSLKSLLPYRETLIMFCDCVVSDDASSKKQRLANSSECASSTLAAPWVGSPGSGDQLP